MMKAILTGGSRGLGAALAAALTGRGVETLSVARGVNADLAAACGPLLRQTSLDLADVAAVLAWAADPARDDAPARFLADAQTAFLINNAALLQPIGPLGRQGPAAVARAATVNVVAPLALSDAFAAATDGAADRRILHISSGAGRTAYPGWSVYCATKAALDHHARAAALDETGRLKIASLAPGVIDTDMQGEIRAAAEDDFPLRGRFVALKEDGGLASPAVAAARIVDYLLGPDFAADPTADLRAL